MTASSPSERSTDVPDQATSGAGQSRSGGTIAYTVVALLGGVSALVALGGAVAEEESSVLDVVLWGALTVAMFGTAAHQWWFAGRAEDRSRRIADGISSAEVEATALDSDGEIDTIRRLRVAHPGLRLQDAYGLVKSPQSRADES